ncbi:MAG: hypothetical protein K2H78_01810, partial [Clostridia bacterium]|nr:hypothetical protein [Clostridia bacterium]
MNKFKKAILGLAAAAGISCLCGVAAGCAPKYYKLVFEGSGIDYVLQDKLAEFENGGTVRKGVEVRFTVSLGANTVGDPIIYLSDGTTLTPDENGVYSFVMNGETKVSAGGLNGIYTLTMDRFETVTNPDGESVRQECWIHYLDENGNELGDEVRLEGGSNFKFKLNISPYYEQSCSVNCGYDVLEPDANGVYTVENITSDATVRVSGLKQELSFLGRENCGKGTEDDPFLLSRPIDLYYLAVVVNSRDYVTYRDDYYKLADDIDMQGEQLFVVGDLSHENASFLGSFDGNGKTISNFYITDEVIDQTTFVKEYLPNVGLFGNAVATVSSPVVIKNLTLKDYELRVHPGESQARSVSGSLLGAGLGVQITNCHADGEIIAFGDDNQIVFTGGLVGYLQAGYGMVGSTLVTYDSFLRSCSTNVSIEGTGSPRSMGGIVGYLSSANTNAIAYVVNSYSTGDIYGAMHAGGIVGTLGRYSSVSNCYSTSVVSASNTIASAMITPDYMVAYAGGIVGFADEDTVVASCYAANAKLSANSVHGASYQDTGRNYDGVIGHAAESGSVEINSASPVLYNNQPKRSGATPAMFTETLGWSVYDWNFSGDLPVVQTPAGALNEKRELTIIVKDADGKELNTYSYAVSERPPVHEWYSQNKLPVYETSADNGKLSWGYYFDKALTQKVPYGFVPAATQTTLYVGFADYAEVAGTYYVSDAIYSNGAYIELDANGNVFFRNGGLTYRSKYTYDGDEVTFIDSAFANLLYTMEEINGGYCTFRGIKTDDGFTLSGKATLLDLENSTAENEAEVIRDLKFNVVKASSAFTYGEYYADNGTTYTFNKGGTGVFINARKVRQNFTYTISGNEIDIVYDGANGGATATLAGGKVTKVGNETVRLKDGFAGLWLATANSVVSFEFDG